MTHPHHLLKIITWKYILVSFVLGSFSLKAQEDGVVLVIPDREARIIMDGIEKGTAKANSALRIVTTAGEHYVEAQSTGNGPIQNKGELIQLEAGKQKILKLTLSQLEVPIATENIIPVADLNFNLPGSLDAMAWTGNDQNKGKPFPVPEYFYAFDKGDEIILNLTMSNLKGTNVISISTYPDGVERFTNKAFVELKDLTIKVPERAIYRFAFASNHILARNAFFKIGRKPTNESLNFNTKVSFKRQLTPVSVLEAQNFFINSGTNATFMGGKSRVVVPVKLPVNTVEWFYRFSASRDQADIDNVKKNFSLFSEITKLIGLTGPAASVATIAIDHLSQPPGANYCGIYFIEQQYIQSFQAKDDSNWKYYPEGSRENFKSGNVKVTCCNSGDRYLGIKNPDSTYGVNVSIEIVALVANDGYVMEGN